MTRASTLRCAYIGRASPKPNCLYKATNGTPPSRSRVVSLNRLGETIDERIVVDEL